MGGAATPVPYSRLVTSGPFGGAAYSWCSKRLVDATALVMFEGGVFLLISLFGYRLPQGLGGFERHRAVVEGLGLCKTTVPRVVSTALCVWLCAAASEPVVGRSVLLSLSTFYT